MKAKLILPLYLSRLNSFNGVDVMQRSEQVAQIYCFATFNPFVFVITSVLFK